MIRQPAFWCSSEEGLNCVIGCCEYEILFCFVGDKVSLCRFDCPRTHSVDQAGLKLKDLLASASQVLGLKVLTSGL